MDRTKLKYLRKLASTRNFILITDTDAAMRLKDVNPKSFDDTLILASQVGELSAFRDKLDEIISGMDKELSGLLNAPRKKSKMGLKPPTKGKKIPVKQL